MNFKYRLYHDCARTLKRSLSGKLAIVELLSDLGFARNSSKHPRTLASFSRARMPCSACTRNVTCELYCKQAHVIFSVYTLYKLIALVSLLCIAIIAALLNR